MNLISCSNIARGCRWLAICWIGGCVLSGWNLQAAPQSAAPSQADATPAAAASTRLGVVSERPSSGPFVEIPGGFMVPYEVTIPGTTAKFTMIPIPAGTFLLGSPEAEEGRKDDEGPQVQVTTKPFWMGKYEVTWIEYKSFMKLDEVFKEFNYQGIREVTEDRKQDAVTAPSSLYDPTFTFEAGDGDDQPAASMTQFAAKQYTKYLSLLTDDFYRLPTEAEWEYACRAGSTTAYYFGDDAEELKKYGWFTDNSNEKRRRQGRKEPNAFGLYDMHGNVAEWVLDAYQETGYQHWADRKDLQADEFAKSEKLFPRVVRGGSFEMEAEECRSAARLASDDKGWKESDPNYPKSPWWYTESPAIGVGFRLVRPLESPATREAKEQYWSADVASITSDVENRFMGGKGALGVIDAKLVEAVEKIKSGK
jgi:formylglycine-generating enzyme required for sulfatase activity